MAQFSSLGGGMLDLDFCQHFAKVSWSNKAGPTPSAYSAHVFVGKHVNTPSRIYCSDLDPHFDTVKPVCFE